MSTDIYFHIFDPESKAIVCHRWVGGRVTLETIRETLARPADYHPPKSGLESWGHLTSEEVLQISHYADGVTPEEVVQYAKSYPADKYWWFLERDY